MKSKIILIRHGETVWNREGRKQGHGDSELTAKGKQQAKAIGKTLLNSGLLDDEYQVVCSPLGRTRSTAEIICAQAQIPSDKIRFEKLLMESDHGDWEGMTASEIEAKYPGQMDERRRDHWNYRFPSGESYADLMIRVDRWLGAGKMEGTTIVVTHDMMSRVIRKQLLRRSVNECLSLKHNQNEYFILSDGCVLRQQADVD
ncbi:MAG: broad specificity phosphatase PhoE [Candidatus Promineifilaceae bacterium]|jgi:broad specificity phosphatase PhoE